VNPLSGLASVEELERSDDAASPTGLSGEVEMTIKFVPAFHQTIDESTPITA